MISVTVGEEENGRRADVVVAAACGVSRSAALHWFEDGRVTVKGKTVKAGLKLQAGDLLSVDRPPEQTMSLEPEPMPLDIVYEDAHLIVINKPAGMVVHPAPGHTSGTLVHALLAHCTDLSGINGVLRPGIVHRLDRDTAGLMVAAKSDAAHLGLAAQLQRRTMHRTYHALIVGQLAQDAGTVDAPIARDPRHRKKMAVVEGGRPAVTHWQVLERKRLGCLVECRLETGRTHQIRVHMAHIGHPVLGDPVYGRPFPGLAGQALCAVALSFVHPITGEAMEFHAEEPDFFRAAWAKNL